MSIISFNISRLIILLLINFFCNAIREQITKHDELPNTWDHIFDSHEQIYEETIPYSDIILPDNNSEENKEDFLSKIYFEQIKPLSSNIGKLENKFYLALFNYKKEIDIDSENIVVADLDSEKPFEINLSQDMVIGIELKGSTKSVTIDAKNNTCIHFLAFLTPQEDLIVNYYPNFGLNHIVLYNDYYLEDYLRSYKRSPENFQMTISNHIQKSENIYLRIFCLFHQIKKNIDNTLSISVEKGTEPIKGNSINFFVIN